MVFLVSLETSDWFSSELVMDCWEGFFWIWIWTNRENGKKRFLYSKSIFLFFGVPFFYFLSFFLSLRVFLILMIFFGFFLHHILNSSKIYVRSYLLSFFSTSLWKLFSFFTFF